MASSRAIGHIAPSPSTPGKSLKDDLYSTSNDSSTTFDHQPHARDPFAALEDHSDDEMSLASRRALLKTKARLRALDDERDTLMRGQNAARFPSAREAQLSRDNHALRGELRYYQQMEPALRATRKQYHLTSRKLEQSRTHLANASQYINDCHAQLQEFDGTISHLRTENKRLRREREDYQLMADGAADEIVRLEVSNTRLQEERNRLLHENEQVRAIAMQLQHTNVELRDEMGRREQAGESRWGR